MNLFVPYGFQALVLRGGENIVLVDLGSSRQQMIGGLGNNNMKSIGYSHGLDDQVEVDKSKSK